MLCLQDLFNILSSTEKEQMMILCHQWRDSINIDKAASITLSPEEINLLEKNRLFDTIKSIRERTGESLLVAKQVVDNYRGGSFLFTEERKHPDD